MDNAVFCFKIENPVSQSFINAGPRGTVGSMSHEPEVLGLIPSPVIHFRFSFR